MRANNRGPGGAPPARSRQQRPQHQQQQQQQRGDAPVKKFARRGGGGGASSPAAIVELTRVQQLEAKAARDAVVAALPKSTPAAAKKFVEAISLDVDVDASRQLLLPRKGLTALPNSIGVLCKQLRKLDMSNNDLTDLSPLASLQHLSNLNVAHNPRLTSLKGLSGTCLSVLNISFCAVESLVGLEHTALSLRTLIANDNRLQFQSPLFRSTSSSTSSNCDGEDATAALQADLSAASAHLPDSLRAAVPVNPTAMRNFMLFATFQQCETVVLSRNAQLVQCFPAWSAEELAVACGDQPRQPTRDSGDDSAEEVEEDTEQKGQHASAQRNAMADAEAEGPAANRELKRAVALAHPLAVFERLPRLKKLSLSGCEVHSLPSRWFLPMVTELRLAQNHLTSLQPDGVILRSLHILDISNNLFMSVATLRRCRYLEQLNVRGNPLVEEGAVQDRAAGVGGAAGNTANTTGEPTDASPAAAAAVPISVQQRVARLFPAVKLLDNQPLLTAAEMRAAYKRGREAATESSKKAASASETGEAAPALDGGAEEDNEIDPSSTDAAPQERGEKAPSSTRTAASASTAGRAPGRKVARVDPAAIAAEAEEKDVVIEAPASVVKTAHAPIVRRERVLLRPGVAAAKGGDARKRGGGGAAAAAPTLMGQAAVHKVLEQNRKPSAW